MAAVFKHSFFFTGAVALLSMRIEGKIVSDAARNVLTIDEEAAEWRSESLRKLSTRSSATWKKISSKIAMGKYLIHLRAYRERSWRDGNWTNKSNDALLQGETLAASDGDKLTADFVGQRRIAFATKTDASGESSKVGRRKRDSD